MASLVDLLRTRMKMLREDATAVAAVVEDAFRGGNEVDDANLDKDMRQVFYELQDSKVLEVRRTEGRDEDGANRRHYMWQVRDEAKFEEPTLPAPPAPEEKLYHKLSDAAWERRPRDPSFQ